MADHPGPDERRGRVSLRGLTKRYGSVNAVDDLDLEVTPGSFTTLLGPSGCGKTTALRMIAGFVEPGEALEEAVAREVFEEVGLEIQEASYYSSQPWPFPSSLMLGFHARADFRPLRVQPDELESARWFSREEVLNSPEDEQFHLPRRDSISYRLIQAWLREDAR